MWFLFLFISIIYSFIFLIFDLLIDWKYDLLNRTDINKLNNDNIINLLNYWQNKDTFYTFFWNLQIENIVFIIIGIFLYFYFSTIKIIDHKKDSNIESNISFKENIFNIVNIFWKSSYYIWLILFYFSIYLISTTQTIISFSEIILWFLILIYISYFLSKKSKFSRDLLRINSLLFSFYYVINYIYIFYTNINTFDSIDFYNWFLVIFIFPVLLYNHTIFSNDKNINKNIIIHFILYIFSFLIFYSKFYLNDNDIFYWLCIIPILFSFVLFEVFTKIKIFKLYIYTFRTVSLIFLYLWIIFWILYSFFEWINYFIYFILILWILFNFYVHKKFQNYASFFIWNITILSLLNISLFEIDILNNYYSLNYLLFNLVYSFILVWLTYILNFKYKYDIYFMHIFSYLINIIWIWLYLSHNLDILYMWILLFIDSLYFFLSYNKLSRIK